LPNTFYRAFEDRLRGSRELIKERQKVYLPFLQPLKQLYAENPVLDLGCGRGEWLEALLEEGFQARGVDLDEGMLEACEALNLPAEQGEAIAMLERTPEASMAVVSGFHIAEHIPFSCLQHLVGEALRVLKPAGLLILETPNPENLVVGTNNFYLDPTHERPIPHLALNFLAEYSGFARTKTLRLQELPQLLNETNLELMHVLGGASPDYGIVAQKFAAEEQLALFDDAFAKEYGLALDMLAWRYDHGLKSKIGEIAEKVDSHTQKEAALYGHLAQLQSKSEQLEQLAANFDENICLIRNQSQQAAELAAQAQAGAASLELRAVQLETVVDQLRLQLQESGLRLLQSEARSQQAEMTLREWLARATLAEAKHAAAETINESLRQQTQSATAEMLASYKAQQKLELMLEQAEQALSNTLQELQSARDEAEQVSAEDVRARQLLEQALAQTEQVLSNTQQELQSVRDEAEQASAENMHARQLFDQTIAQAEEQAVLLGLELGAVKRSAEMQEERVYAIQHQLNESLGSAHHLWQQAIVHEQRIKALLSSASWRITWPLRALSRAVSWTARLPLRLAKSLARTVLHLVMRLVLGRPALRVKLARLLQRHPNLHQHLRLFAKRRNLISDFPPVDTGLTIQEGCSSPEQAASSRPDDAQKGADLSALSVDARCYFHQLNNAIEQQKPGSL
jgi:SAM-dependent methyltransferase